jgi:hypothetical protein
MLLGMQTGAYRAIELKKRLRLAKETYSFLGRPGALVGG